jgi:hypothetical protein
MSRKPPSFLATTPHLTMGSSTAILSHLNKGSKRGLASKDSWQGPSFQWSLTRTSTASSSHLRLSSRVGKELSKSTLSGLSLRGLAPPWWEASKRTQNRLPSLFSPLLTTQPVRSSVWSLQFRR